MPIHHARMSRRNLLTVAGLGLPAIGVLGAGIHLSGAQVAYAAPSAGEFVDIAETKRGCAYVWATQGPDTFDCSGLILWALAQVGIDMPRVSTDQINACEAISVEEALATRGALLYLPEPRHIAISEGNGATMEARSESQGVDIFTTPLGWTRGGLVPGLSYSGGSGGGESNPGGELTVDGYWGKSTTTKLQQHFGTPVDGIVSSQDATWKAANPGLASGWEWVSNASGSPLIGKIQQAVGATADGLIGPETIKAIQKRFGVAEDGVFPDQSQCIQAMQNALNNAQF